MTPREFAELLKGKLLGEAELELTRPAPFFAAGSRDVTFYQGEDAGELVKSGAGCVICGIEPDRFNARSLIVVSDVGKAWAKALETFPLPQEEDKPNLTFVSDSATVDASSRLLPFTYVGPDVDIGADCVIGPNVTVHARTVIGNNVRVGAGSVIGSEGFGYVGDNGKYLHLPHLGSVVIEENVDIGAGVCIDRGTMAETRICKGTKIDNLVHIAHNVLIGRNCIITGQCGIAGSSILEEGVMIAGQSGVSDHVHIGAGAKIYAKSAVFKDVEPDEIVSGIPARPHRKTLRAQARLFKDESSKDS
ncbi:UDP-3-O-(3-hydroxymyristoyl)glucosamine N-acyltransferase [candidate division WOR-3 bacterium]|uniref:UDP-3-O-(3-hydroxymyristoyl)glucosamine N-acyltransferase n=1 Tax=candidate division WOR-3 bacterium TaxID=2052148 RepID=A0A9D5KAF5_UNCW3|nr:UDP-3-O-(3-hydroxymyristoyl)glucosamine N-acyltransferase [candidate division WOR-3 bacterium]MBD3365452.1 UDP-3-O-(3-hydroxymyristoyl)glucosamine N-acyltransferase [candidate division WOR-3 bacterium]